jgi:hypothetical protein
MSADAAIAALASIQRQVDELSRMPRKLAAACAPEITKLLQAGYRAGTDPYGRAWRRLRPATLAKHGPPPLTHHGKLRDGTRARLLDGNRAGLSIVVGKPYGAFHQVGFRVHDTKVAPRRVLPAFGMPASWREVFKVQAARLAAEARRA